MIKSHHHSTGAKDSKHEAIGKTVAGNAPKNHLISNAFYQFIFAFVFKDACFHSKQNKKQF